VSKGHVNGSSPEFSNTGYEVLGFLRSASSMTWGETEWNTSNVELVVSLYASY
jgi:hypothetical protein